MSSFVLEVFSLGPKRPVVDKFIEVHVIADVDRLVRELGRTELMLKSCEK